MTALVDLLIGDSTLLLYFSESRTQREESKLYYSTHFPKFVVIYICVLLLSQKFFEYCGDDSQDKIR